MPFGRLKIARATVSAASMLLLAASVFAQPGPEQFVSGQVAVSWEKWTAAMQAVLARQDDVIEFTVAEFLGDNPSALRTAMFAERTILQRSLGGAVLLLEQDGEAASLGGNAAKLWSLLATGRERLKEASDGWYFAAIGRFDVSAANFRALLDSNPDPVALLELADAKPRRRQILIQLADNPIVGSAARDMTRALQAGDDAIKADPIRIKQNLDALAGPPRAFEFAAERLADSGEYAVPFIVQYLRDSSKKNLTRQILRVLPRIDRPALNPLVMALRMNDHATTPYLIGALGSLGYAQAAPYLMQLVEAEQTPTEIRAAAKAALDDLSTSAVAIDAGVSAAEAFYWLAKLYYQDDASLAADIRLDSANVWYWKDDLLQNVEVPTSIFNEVMAMRCCEEALRLKPDLKPALALWLAANFRREAQLPEGAYDATRPDGYPPASYFAQSAGPEYCLMALARAVDDGDPAVALGAIEAIRKTAGPASVLPEQLGRQPLAEALSFPDRMVRIRAALALAGALPSRDFHNSQQLIPVLNEAVMLYGGARNALVVDPESATANSVSAALRAAGYNVISDADLFNGLEKIRTELPGVDVITIASDIGEPGLEAGLDSLRTEFRFAATPVLIVAKAADQQAVRDLVRGDHRLGAIQAAVDARAITGAIARVARSVGATDISPDVGLGLSIEATMALRLLAITHNSVFDVAESQAALIAALSSSDAILRRNVAGVLAYVASADAQEAVARIALDASEETTMRVSMFAALADSAKLNGNLLGADAVARLTRVAESDADMTIRSAGSQTLGALNLPGNPASEIIRNQYGG